MKTQRGADAHHLVHTRVSALKSGFPLNQA